MSRQYLRSLNLAVGNGSSATTIQTQSGGPGLRVRFRVEQKEYGKPGNALITITNLSDATANKIRREKEYDQVVLQVGYGSDLKTLFTGDIKQKIGNGQETPTETYFKILAAAGQEAYSYAFISKTLAAGHTFKDQINACLEVLGQYGITAGHISDLGSQKMPRGRVLFGMVREQLRMITKTNNATWWIHDNKLNILKNTQSLPGSTIVLNSQTGLIGIPVQTINGIEVRCLCNPDIKPGTLIHIDERDIAKYVESINYADQVKNQVVEKLAPLSSDGLYTVIFAEHFGDTRGTDWYTDMICNSAGSGVVTPATAQRGPPVVP